MKRTEQIKRLERVLNTVTAERQKRKIGESDFMYWQGIKNGVKQAIYQAGFVIYECNAEVDKSYYIL